MAGLNSEIIIGIDLGTTNSLVAACDKGVPRTLKSKEGHAIVPSAVYWNEKAKSVQVGTVAKTQRLLHPHETATSIKRLMGKGRKDLKSEEITGLNLSASTDQNILVKLGNENFTAIELSAAILKRLKSIAEENLGQTVSKAVVTVPAYFNDAQRAATKAAGTLSGLDVVRILNEPTAAALAYGLQKKQNELIAVYDLGGGTFDISLLKIQDGIFEVLSTGGDTALGGDDFDRALAYIIARQLPYESSLEFEAFLLESAEKFKLALSRQEVAEETLIYKGTSKKISLTRAQLNKAIEGLIQKTLKITEQALKDARLKKEQIDEIVMVGGSTRVPAVQEAVRAFFGKDINQSVNPDEVVALGAAVQADILAGHNDNMVLLDIIPLSLGIETYGGTIGKILHRNTKIPAMAHETFTTHVDGQKNVLIHVLQGERELATDCRSLGKFNLKGLPPMPAGLPKIQVTFLVDANGLLKVSAVELATKTEAHIEVTPSFGLTDEEVEKMLQASYDFAEQDMQSRQLIDTRVEADGILRSAEKILKEAENLGNATGLTLIREKMAAVQKAKELTDHIAIKSALEALEEAAKPVAAIVMDQALKNRITQKTVGDVLTTTKKEN